MIHRNIIIQKLDILAELNAINDGQLYILRGNKRWPIVYIEGPQVIFSEKNAFFH